ncbi:hypothetical protein CMsap09_13570 [Clavibacter michiganensis]|uniref:MORN repeat variant n=1 Tax=Clavibacter michiganensis TaxID=28447 RepID=A0A251XWK8_9MICO|nr:hypothetical protein CMsap09_13570 [Clavibacter michiganensis]
MSPDATPDDATGRPLERTVLHRDGSLRARGGMLGDQQHGMWAWYRLDGTMLRSGSFDHGRQVGEWTTYDRSGAPYKVTRFPPAG